jgi:hypothetical protein
MSREVYGRGYRPELQRMNLLIYSRAHTFGAKVLGSIFDEVIHKLDIGAKMLYTGDRSVTGILT